ncbi:MAG: hypothetical protein R3275_05640 [Saprospiraceae bacterium]|nr:hypothetical protein [Saprospiraceae bacterium]
MIIKSEIASYIQSRSDSHEREEAERLIYSGKVDINTYNEAFIKGKVDGEIVQLLIKEASLNILSNCSCVKVENKLCPHSLAFLLQLKKQLKSSSPRKGVKYWRKMVSEMEAEDLSRLVVDFARRNKAFAMELQAINVGRPGDEDPYQLAEALLQEIRDPIVRSVKKPSTIHVRLVINTCKALLRSSRQLIDGDYPVEGIKILIKIIEIIFYLSHKRRSMNPTSNKIIKACQNEILERLEGLRAPEVNEELVRHFLQMLKKSYISVIDDQFIPEIFARIKLAEHESSFIKVIERQIDNSEGYEEQLWLSIWLQCYNIAQDSTRKTDFEPSNEQRLALWRIFKKDPAKYDSDPVLKMLYSSIPPSFTKFALRFAIDHAQWKRALNILKYDVDHDISLDENAAQSMLEIMDSENIALDSTNHLHLLMASKDISRLSEYVKDKNKLGVTADVIHLNTKKNAFISFGFLRDQIDEFLIHHIGPASRRVITKLVEGLHQSGHKELLNSVVQHLREKYGMEEQLQIDNLSRLIRT